MLPAQEEVQAQQTEVMQTPQGTVAETAFEDINEPITMDLGQPIQAEETEVVFEETPLKMKTLSAKDLIKKYS